MLNIIISCCCTVFTSQSSNIFSSAATVHHKYQSNLITYRSPSPSNQPIFYCINKLLKPAYVASWLLSGGHLVGRNTYQSINIILEATQTRQWRLCLAPGTYRRAWGRVCPAPPPSSTQPHQVSLNVYVHIFAQIKFCFFTFSFL